MPAQTAPNSPTVRVSRMLPATAAEAFAAWLDADAICDWMRPDDIERTQAEVDARVGGRFRIVMHGVENEYEMTGEYVEIDPPRRLVFTWETNVTEGESLLTVEFHDRGDETEIVLTHERICDAETADHYEKGWSQVLDRLATQLES